MQQPQGQGGPRRRIGPPQPQAQGQATTRVGRLFADEEQHVQKKREQGFLPYRFWLSNKPEAIAAGNNECAIIILDHTLEDGFYRYEHDVQGADGSFGNHVECVKDRGHCQYCSDGDSKLVLFLTALVFKPYTSKKTGKTREYSRMFLCIKRNQYNEFARLEKIALEQYGTMRGMYLWMRRDGGSQTSSSIGSAVPLDNGMLFDIISEEELEQDYGHPQETGDGGKIIKARNADITVFDYRKLMPQTDPDAQAAGRGRATPGSRAANDYHDESDEIPGNNPQQQTRTRQRGPAQAQPQQQPQQQPNVRQRPAQQQPQQPQGGAPRQRGPAPQGQQAAPAQGGQPRRRAEEPQHVQQPPATRTRQRAVGGYTQMHQQPQQPAAQYQQDNGNEYEGGEYYDDEPDFEGQ